MTDERIKEEFYKWNNTDPTHKELEILHEDKCDLTRVTFYAGFRAAERLAKIEALEGVLSLANDGRVESLVIDIQDMIAELKEEGE